MEPRFYKDDPNDRKGLNKNIRELQTSFNPIGHAVERTNNYRQAPGKSATVGRRLGN